MTKSRQHHGQHKTVEYRTWVRMRQRCQSRAHHKWASYGGRGIKVCARWAVFAAFRADMGPRPSSAHSLDRIDNNGNYCPENCRWATRAEQMANTRAIVWLSMLGETKTMTAWSADPRCAVSAGAFRCRVYRGWDPLDAFTSDKNTHRMRINGKAVNA